MFVVGIAAALVVPLLAVYGLVWGRHQAADEARASIVQGWGGRQILAGPLLAIPYTHDIARTVTENGVTDVKVQTVSDELILWPETMKLDTRLDPERRRRAIYTATVYDAHAQGLARFVLPKALAAQGIDPARLELGRAQVRLGLSQPEGFFGDPPRVVVDGRPVTLQPGDGPKATGGAGISGQVDASALTQRPIEAAFDLRFRGDTALGLVPRAGDTLWRVRSAWPDPSFKGRFLPASRSIGAGGFDALYRVGNLAIGRPLTGDDDQVAALAPEGGDARLASVSASPATAEVHLLQPVDLYSLVDRATKYGFLFIGFTFLVFLLFELVGRVRVSAAEYLLVGVALVLFFVLLLAFAEVVGFAGAYVIASAAILGLVTAYSAAVLRSRLRAGFVGALLATLYATLYLLINLEAFALLVGAVMLFLALAGVMWATRSVDWRGSQEVQG